MKTRRIAALCGAATTALALAAGTAQAIDIQPMDWTPLPAGTSIAALYVLHGRNDGVTLNGSEIDGKLTTTFVLPRLAHYFELGGRPAAVSMILPFGKLSDGEIDGAGLNAPSGLGDMIISGGTWLVNNPEQRQSVVLAGYLKLPTGRYDSSRALNIGSDRHSVALQIGGQTAVSEKLTLEGTIDAEFFANNDNADGAGETGKTDTLYSFQSYLTYAVSPTTFVSAGYAAYKGGDQSIGGVETGFKSDRQQVRLGVTTFLNETTTLFGEFTHDFDVKGGFRQDTGLMVRVAKFF
ncbi:MAG: transporter [Paracoccus sp. BP8]|uniref:transporter n=1 Tax=Paracoccus sp. J39 TaxID=935848 RepID=UPI0004917EF4|nr:transporter [Paracoccus sp. J39]RQP08156.1 MAG: transporter [Paracoccus sp. BP8]